jgi:hypothetical protein
MPLDQLYFAYMKLFPKLDLIRLSNPELFAWIAFAPLALLFVVSGVLLYRLYLRTKKRTEAMRAIAESLEMEFVAEKCDPSTLGLDGIDLFEIGLYRKVFNLMKGTFGDTNVFIFDYHYDRGGKYSSTYSQTVIAHKISSKDGFQLPKFTCKPERFYHRFADMFGLKDIDFKQYPEFSKAYRLIGEDTDSVRKIFNETVIRQLEAESKSPWNVGGAGEWLVIHKHNEIIKPNDCPQFLLDCTTLLNAMTLT